jgi:hypothetical protein
MLRWFLIALALCASASLSAQARVCLSSSAVLTEASAIDCDLSAPTTLNQLALSGWKVVQALPIYVNGEVRVQLLLRREDKIFVTGFE